MGGAGGAEQQGNQAARVHVALVAWAERFPAMGGPRLNSMARACAASCEGASDESVVELAIFCMILFGIDDLGDRALAPMSDEAIDAQLREFATIVLEGGAVSSAPHGAPGQVFRALDAFCRRLSSRRAVYPLFARHLAGMLDGMREEVAMSREFTAHARLPSWDRYVELGTRTVGMPPVGAVMLALEGPEAPCLDSNVERLLTGAGRCVRFANDLRSYAREVGEGKPNSVSLKMAAHGWSEAQARQAVATARDEEARELAALVGQLPGELRRWGESFHRYTTFIVDWYAVAELHEAAPQLQSHQPAFTRGVS